MELKDWEESGMACLPPTLGRSDGVDASGLCKSSLLKMLLLLLLS